MLFQVTPSVGQSSLTRKCVKATRMVSVRAEEPKKKAPPKKKKNLPPGFDEEGNFTTPTLEPGVPSPVFYGSDNGLWNNARTEEFYVIMWVADKEHLFKMPSSGVAQMRIGKNMLKLPRKEMCLALTTQLRTDFKISPCFWRVFPTGEVQYLHPKDGVYPEKVNAGRSGEGYKDRALPDAPQPADIKFESKQGFDM